MARVTGTSESNVAAYERGDKVPGPPTEERILSAIEAGSDSPIYVHGLVTSPQASAAIRRGLRRGWTPRELLRIVREQRSNYKWISRPIDQQVFLARPFTTGDRRWDALLAGATEELAARSNIPAPLWTEGIHLEEEWFVTDDPAFHQYLSRAFTSGIPLPRHHDRSRCAGVGVKSDGPLLGKERITELLFELGRRCAASGVSVDMLVVGGGAIALAYNGDRTTRDIDAIFEPKMRVYAITKIMADELGLPRDWLNDGVKGLLPDFKDGGLQFTVAGEGIRIVVPSPEYLFAMKAVSARIGIDDDDVRLLGRRIGITSAAEAFEAVERFYRRERVSAKAGFYLETIFQSHVVLNPEESTD